MSDRITTGELTACRLERPESPQPNVSRNGWRLAIQFAAVVLVVACAVGGSALARWLQTTPERPAPDKQADAKFSAKIFEGWGKPDLVLLISGQQIGYLQPCGCSRPQVGGLERRYNLVRQMKAAGWPVVGLDLGDISQKRGPAELRNVDHTLLKYVYSMKALKLLGYAATGIGEHETNLGLATVLAEYALNDPVPAVVASNLIAAEKNFPEQTKPWHPVDVKSAGMRLGVAHIVGPDVSAKIKEVTVGDKAIRFGETKGSLDAVVKQMRESRVDLPILLYQGPVTRNGVKKPLTEAAGAAESFPEFPLVVALSEDEPPSRPTTVKTKADTNSWVITVGTKGRYVGVVGVYKTGKVAQPYTYRYERVQMSEDFMTPAAEEKDHPLMGLMEEYAKKLRDDNYLAKYTQVRHEIQAMAPVKDLKKPGEATYVGSESCKKCHKEAYEVWEKSGHSHAYDTLVKASKPGERQFDPECIVCHTVGFGFQSGYVDAKKTGHLKDVGCESCHGPCSVHVDNNYNKEWHRRINPWKYLPEAKRTVAIDLFCQKCHDIDNDVHWINDGFKKKWPLVAHPTPKD